MRLLRAFVCVGVCLAAMRPAPAMATSIAVGSDISQFDLAFDSQGFDITAFAFGVVLPDGLAATAISRGTLLGPDDVVFALGVTLLDPDFGGDPLTGAFDVIGALALPGAAGAGTLFSLTFSAAPGFAGGELQLIAPSFPPSLIGAACDFAVDPNAPECDLQFGARLDVSQDNTVTAIVDVVPPDATAVPEPGTLALFGTGIAAIVRRRRTRA
jgi:hypothetical protein